MLVDGHQSVDGQHGRQRDEEGATDIGALSDTQADVVLHPGPTPHQGHDPDGRLMKKIQCQLSSSISAPPRGSPSDPPVTMTTA